MKRIISLLIVLVLCSGGCASLNGGAYNSRSLFDLLGNNMTFKRGVTGTKVVGVDRVVISRETNAGNTEAPKPLPVYDMNYCPEDPTERFADGH